jgi:hypothetical protein
MPMSPQEFYAHAMRAADAGGRLPLSRMTAWDVFPFEHNGLQVVPLARRGARLALGRWRGAPASLLFRPAGRVQPAARYVPGDLG